MSATACRSHPARSDSWASRAPRCSSTSTTTSAKTRTPSTASRCATSASCFEALLGAHGVGPALALAIMAVHAPLDLRRAVAADDADALCLVPGVGKKTAARLLIDLKSRLDVPEIDLTAVNGSAAVHSAGTRAMADVREALTGLGYSTDEVRDAVRDLDRRRRLGRAAARSAAAPGRRCAAMREELLEPAPDAADARARGQPAAAHARRVRRPSRAEGAPRHHPRGGAPARAGGRPPPVRRAARARQDHARGHRRRTSSASHLHVTSGPALERAGDLAAILTKLDEGDVLFIDEIHRLGRPVEEILYPAMEDFQLDIVVGKGPAASSIRLAAAPVHAGRRHDAHRPDHRAAPRPVRLRRPPRLLRSRRARGDRASVPRRSSAFRSTPRAPPRSRAARAARRASRTACFAGCATSPRCAATARSTRDVASDGLARVRRRRASVSTRSTGRSSRAICERFGGGPVGLSTLAISVGEQPETVEDVYEPFLMQLGLLQRTPRGRVASASAFDHLGVRRPVVERAAGLFDS